ncbi:hypothetical protein BD309DRAFT_953248 [Dichomitus squalens]|uniref:Uncharacterized protein n=1 Tax=Dichomitus squalens TaxID=114155 RepID=A0A4Q9P484_9APHY|nr:hypothetical protein BD309DRAFT_953248 [Dichomitus squalens]TBU63025.1 hypothetical protein BD310DRAFT_917652 [Dichomitus squalens]
MPSKDEYVFTQYAMTATTNNASTMSSMIGVTSLLRSDMAGRAVPIPRVQSLMFRSTGVPYCCRQGASIMTEWDKRTELHPGCRMSRTPGHRFPLGPQANLTSRVNYLMIRPDCDQMMLTAYCPHFSTLPSQKSTEPTVAGGISAIVPLLQSKVSFKTVTYT